MPQGGNVTGNACAMNLSNVPMIPCLLLFSMMIRSANKIARSIGSVIKYKIILGNRFG